MTCKNTNVSEGFTQERLDALESAIAEGILRVKYSDKEVTYQSMDDLLKARALCRRKLGLDANAKGTGLFGGKRIHGRPTKGLHEY